MLLKFTDGIEFNLSGPLRVEKRKDGFYVVGEGGLEAVKTREEGLQIIAQMKKLR